MSANETRAIVQVSQALYSSECWWGESLGMRLSTGVARVLSPCKHTSVNMWSVINKWDDCFLCLKKKKKRKRKRPILHEPHFAPEVLLFKCSSWSASPEVLLLKCSSLTTTTGQPPALTILYMCYCKVYADANIPCADSWYTQSDSRTNLYWSTIAV